MSIVIFFFFFFQAEDGIRDLIVTGVQTCALPISSAVWRQPRRPWRSSSQPDVARDRSVRRLVRPGPGPGRGPARSVFGRSQLCSRARRKEWAMALTTALALVLVLVAAAPAGAAWEPTKPIEFVVPAGTGGGADQMARLISGIAEKHKLSPRPLIVVNKSG